MKDEKHTDLEKLLATVNALDPDKRVQGEDPPTDEELSEARKGLEEAATAALEGDNPDNAAGRDILAAIEAIDAEVVTRTEAREAARVEAAEMLKRIKGEQDDEGDKGDEGKGEGDGDEDAKPEADAKPETEQAPDTKKPVTVAASLSEAIKRSDRRRTERVVEAPPSTDVIVASTGIAQGYGLGQDANLDTVADLFNKYARQVQRGSSVLVHMERLYPEDRSLGLSAEENTRKIAAVTEPPLTALTAAGGVCEPLPADFTHPICGDRGRPIRDGLPGFRADRGGARFAPSATVADLEGGITVWTSATDEEPSAETKACPRVDCEAEESATVDAIVACLTVGNFQARFNPEFWRSRLDLLMVAHDRIAEQTLYATMLADPVTQLTAAPAAAGDGTVTDVLRVIDYQVAGIRSRHRLIGTQFRTILPSWLRNALRTQLANQAPAGSADLFDIGDQRLAQFFSARGVTPIWSPDIELMAASQGAGALEPYNTPFTVLTFPEGTFLFLDGGTLDLGTQITDSTLNATNDRQAFMETFEQVKGRGCEALATPVAVAADCICA